MSLKKGYSKPTISANIAELRRAGYSREQAVRIAFERARETWNKRAQYFKKRGFRSTMPAYLRGAEYLGPKMRARNPVSSSQIVQLQEAQKLYENFTGHDGEVIGHVEIPDTPKAVAVIGEVAGILYDTVRDGKHEKYIHEFKKSARPLFTVSSDGKRIFLIGGSYDFTELGIVDK